MHLKAISITFLASFLGLGTAQASWDLTGTVTSDYLYNGITQSDSGPAVQFTANKNFNDGWYAGAFASSVDFGDDTWLELEGFAGRYWQINDQVEVEFGALYYTYHGEGSNFDYAEATAAIYISGWRLQSWYSWDYAGSSGSHLIVEAAYQLYSDGMNSLNVGFNQSRSLDSDYWQWDTRDHYNHAWIAADRSWKQWHFLVSFNHATLSSEWDGGNTLAANISYTF